MRLGFPPEVLAQARSRPGAGSPELRAEAGGSSMRSVAPAALPGLLQLPPLLPRRRLQWLRRLQLLLLLLRLLLLCSPPLSLPVPT